MGPACFAKAFSVGICQPGAREEAGVYQQAKKGYVHTRLPGFMFVSRAAPLLVQ